MKTPKLNDVLKSKCQHFFCEERKPQTTNAAYLKTLHCHLIEEQKGNCMLKIKLFDYIIKFHYLEQSTMSYFFQNVKQ